MESNNNDNYVLVLEDRTEVKNEKETGKLSVVSGIDDKGKLRTTEAWKSHTNLTHPGKYFRPSKVKIMRPTSPK